MPVPVGLSKHHGLLNRTEQHRNPNLNDYNGTKHLVIVSLNNRQEGALLNNNLNIILPSFHATWEPTGLIILNRGRGVENTSCWK